MAGNTKRVLALGVKAASNVAKSLFGEDVPVDYMDKVPGRGKYDAIVSYHHLQRVSHRDTEDTLKEMQYRLKEGGELHLFVPSLEWVAREILKPNPHPMWKIHLFGNQYSDKQTHLNGFTMMELRNVIDDCFNVTHATLGEYTTELNGENYAAEQYYLRGEPK